MAWLLLLVPTLAVGAGALWLVRLEQQRIDERARATVDSRRAAVEARVALIAENLQLLADEARQGLMATLRELDQPDVGAFFTGWEASNPLVATAFHLSAGGYVLRPVDGPTRRALAGWVAAGRPWDEGAPAGWAGETEESTLAPLAAFRRDGSAQPFAAAEAGVGALPADARAGDRAGGGRDADPRRRQAAPPEARTPLDVEQSAVPPSALARQRSDQIAANVVQLQQARSAVQETAARKAWPEEATTPEDSLLQRSEGARFAATAPDLTGEPSPGAKAAPETAAASRLSSVDPERREAEAAPFAALGAAAGDVPAGTLRRGVATPDRTGWSVWRETATETERARLFGWRVRPAGDVVGLELAVEVLAAQLSAALPRAVEADEAYALRPIAVDAAGGPIYATGRWAGRDLVHRVAVPLPAVLLPGWEVAGFLAPNGAERSWSGGGFFLVNAVVVGALMAAILAGGALLWREARRSEAEAAQKASFVSHVSHELRTPLTTIRLYTELLEQDRVKEPARRGELLRTIGEETRRLARLVDQVLDFSRLQRGTPPPARVAVDLRGEIDRLLAVHEPRLAAAGLQLRRELPAGPLPVTTAPDALGQIVLNLLDNAAKYAAAGGEVTVVLAGRPGGGAEVRVRDRGPGVPAAHAAQIFEPFHRVDESLTAGSGGAGLGLGIARSLARAMGGDLRYAPRPGGGADFILLLP
jgi:two-component system phosphate regulon sensor histidine kinase PhoR